MNNYPIIIRKMRKMQLGLLLMSLCVLYGTGTQPLDNFHPEKNATSLLHALSHASSSTSNRKKPPHEKRSFSIAVDENLVGPIQIGDQSFAVMFDTGSKYLWVFGEGVNRDFFDDDPPWFIHKFYDPTASNTFQPCKQDCHQKRFKGRFEDGCRISGKAGFEKLQVGDIMVANAPFYIVNKLRGPGDQFTHYDGMFGLSYSEPMSDTISPLAKLVHARKLNRNMFSVYLNKDCNGGEIVFGSWDTARFHGRTAVVVPSISGTGENGERKHLWGVYITRLSGFGTTLFDEEGAPALLDTGNTHIEIPENMFNMITADPSRIYSIAGEAVIHRYVRCSERTSLPVLQFDIGARTYTMRGEDYTASPSTAPHNGYHFIDDGNVEWCLLFLEASSYMMEEEMGVSIVLGQPFMRKYYTMFFYEYEGGMGGSPMIGLAESRHQGDDEKGASTSTTGINSDTNSWDEGCLFGCGGIFGFGEDTY